MIFDGKTSRELFLKTKKQNKKKLGQGIYVPSKRVSPLPSRGSIAAVFRHEGLLSSTTQPELFLLIKLFSAYEFLHQGISSHILKRTFPHPRLLRNRKWGFMSSSFCLSPAEWGKRKLQVKLNKVCLLSLAAGVLIIKRRQGNYPRDVSVRRKGFVESGAGRSNELGYEISRTGLNKARHLQPGAGFT